jgi:hypothetical protein
VLARPLNACCEPWAKLLDNAEVFVQPSYTRVRVSARKRGYAWGDKFVQQATVRIVSSAPTDMNFAHLLGRPYVAPPLLLYQDEFWPSVEGVVVLGPGAFQGVAEVYGDGWAPAAFTQIDGGLQFTHECLTQRVRLTGVVESTYCVEAAAPVDLELRMLATECNTCTAGVLAVSRFSQVSTSELGLIAQQAGQFEMRGLAIGTPAYVFSRGASTTLAAAAA